MLYQVELWGLYIISIISAALFWGFIASPSIKKVEAWGHKSFVHYFLFTFGFIMAGGSLGFLGTSFAMLEFIELYPNSSFPFSFFLPLVLAIFGGMGVGLLKTKHKRRIL